MSQRSEFLLRWMPRALGIVVCAYLALFALDSFSNELPLARQIKDFGVHLIPALVLFAVILASWKREWIGGVLFSAAAAYYATLAWRHPSWVALVSGPLLVVAAFYFVAWFGHQRALRVR